MNFPLQRVLLKIGDGNLPIFLRGNPQSKDTSFKYFDWGMIF